MGKVDANKRVRREILRVVRRYGAGGISIEGIETIFGQSGLPGEFCNLAENIRYLSDPEKGYLRVERVKDPFGAVERWMVVITARGMNLLDGLCESDPGVEIVC